MTNITAEHVGKTVRIRTKAYAPVSKGVQGRVEYYDGTNVKVTLLPNTDQETVIVVYANGWEIVPSEREQMTEKLKALGLGAVVQMGAYKYVKADAENDVWQAVPYPSAQYMSEEFPPSTVVLSEGYKA